MMALSLIIKNTRFAAGSAIALWISFAPVQSFAAPIPIHTPWTPSIATPGYDESFNFAPPYAVYLFDPALDDLLKMNVNQNGHHLRQSELCVPTAITNALIDEYAFKNPAAPSLKIPGVSADGSSIESSTLVRQLVDACKTDIQAGTDALDAVQCIRDFYRNSGDNTASVKIIHLYNFADPSQEPEGVTVLDRIPTPQDIRDAIQAGYEVLGSVAWMTYHDQQGWSRGSGHTFNIYGYDYKNSTGEMVLKVANSATHYAVDGASPVFGDIPLTPLAATFSTLGLEQMSLFTVSGPSFDRPGTQAFLKELILMKP